MGISSKRKNNAVILDKCKSDVTFIKIQIRDIKKELKVCATCGKPFNDIGI
jgi:hypothetical protein